MMIDLLSFELVGWAAGLSNLISSVPQLIHNIRHPKDACHQNLARNILQAQGNFLWIIYAAGIGARAMIIFAALGTFMALWLLLQIVQARTKAPCV